MCFLEPDGWTVVRQHGSHRIYRHPTRAGQLVGEALDRDGKEFGEDRLMSAVRSNPSTSAGDLLDQVMSSVREFTRGAEQQDDITRARDLLRQRCVGDDPNRNIGQPAQKYPEVPHILGLSPVQPVATEKSIRTGQSSTDRDLPLAWFEAQPTHSRHHRLIGAAGWSRRRPVSLADLKLVGQGENLEEDV